MTELTLVRAAAMMRAGELSCEDYVAALIDQALSRADLNAFSQFDPDRVRAAARKADRQRETGGAVGALHGIPLAIKDCIDIAGMATTGGTPALQTHIVERTAPLVQKLTDAGALVFGKANLFELAFGITSNNDCAGPVRNPFDPTRSAGGSSSGSAVAVAAGMVPASLGTDTAGSVRIPASYCGIFGFRPSHGRYDSSGVMPLFPTRDVPGTMARSAGDLQLLDAVLSGEEAAPAIDPGQLRLGLPGPHFLGSLESGVATVFEEMVARLRSIGVTVVDAELPDVTQSIAEMDGPIRTWELPRSLAAYLEASGAGIDFDTLMAGVAGPYVRRKFEGALRERGARDLAERYLHVLSVQLPKFRRDYRDHLRRHALDGIVFPTTPIAATVLGEDENVRVDDRTVHVGRVMRNTTPATFYGAPGLTIPTANRVWGVPVGMEIDGLPGGDRKLLAIAAALEASMPDKPGS